MTIRLYNEDHYLTEFDVLTNIYGNRIELNQTARADTGTQNNEKVVNTKYQRACKWRIGPVDMHCTGNHLKNTLEIGLIKLRARRAN